MYCCSQNGTSLSPNCQILSSSIFCIINGDRMSQELHLSTCIQLRMTKHPSRKVMNFRHLLGCDTIAYAVPPETGHVAAVVPSRSVRFFCLPIHYLTIPLSHSIPGLLGKSFQTIHLILISHPVYTYTANALKAISKYFLDLRNIFLNQENIREFFSKQGNLSS